MTATIDVAEADRALKASHRATWALGDYPALADELIAELGDVLTGACYGFRRWAGGVLLAGPYWISLMAALGGGGGTKEAVSGRSAGFPGWPGDDSGKGVVG